MIKDLLTTKHNELWLTFLKLQNSEANVLSLNLWNDYGLCEYGIPLSGFFFSFCLPRRQRFHVRWVWASMSKNLWKPCHTSWQLNNKLFQALCAILPVHSRQSGSQWSLHIAIKMPTNTLPHSGETINDWQTKEIQHHKWCKYRYATGSRLWNVSSLNMWGN